MEKKLSLNDFKKRLKYLGTDISVFLDEYYDQLEEDFEIFFRRQKCYYNVICSSISWSETSQGFKFWSNIANKIDKIKLSNKSKFKIKIT